MMPVTQKHDTVGSSGQLLPGIVVRLVKPDGSLAGVDEPGELLIRGPAMALGYLNSAEAWVLAWMLLVIRSHRALTGRSILL